MKTKLSQSIIYYAARRIPTNWVVRWQLVIGVRSGLSVVYNFLEAAEPVEA